MYSLKIVMFNKRLDKIKDPNKWTAVHLLGFVCVVKNEIKYLFSYCFILDICNKFTG